VIRDGRYVAPTAPGFSAAMTPDALEEHLFPGGSAWRNGDG
jgi:L-fuconate dehydratase